MSDPYAEIRKLADVEIKHHAPIQDPGDHGCWGCDANWPCEPTRLARFVLAALPVVEAAELIADLPDLIGLSQPYRDALHANREALAHLKEVTRAE